MSVLIEVFLIGVGLSMDAFAVSVCKGLSMKKIDKKALFIIAFFFGGFQALMPLLGWTLGKSFEKYITNIDHWIAFVLLALIGGKMLYDAFFEKEEENEGEGEKNFVLDYKELVILAIATSIDALAVGITFAFLSYPILISILIIGCTTFTISCAGVLIGNVFGSKYEKRAQIVGGVILILIGLKILLEHLGVLTF